MKTKVVLLMVIFLGSLFFSSCRKTDLREQQEEISATMDQLKASPSFTWETSKTIEAVITGSSTGVIYIRPSEGNDYYNKGLLTKGSPYITSFKVPTYTDQVRLILNGSSQLVPVVGNRLEFNFE